MARSSYLFTSESVAEGHPDKVCDRISDEIVDAYFRAAQREGLDPAQVRVAVETLATTNLVVLAGEVRGPHIHRQTLGEVVRAAVKDIGYEQAGFHHAELQFQSHVHEQSAEIAQGVDESGNKDVGAGDQGIMFGHATNETSSLMPAPIHYSHDILKRMAAARKSGARPEFEPDAKSQVTLRYENGKPVGATSVVVSTQHSEGLSQADVRELVRPFVLEALPDGWMCLEEEFYVNPTGAFVIGGPDGDAGLTGRKIIVDTYGGAGPMAAARSPARIPPRWTARRPMRAAIWRKTSWRPVWRTIAPSRCPMRSGWPSRCRCMSISTAMCAATLKRWRSGWVSWWTSARAAFAIACS